MYLYPHKTNIKSYILSVFSRCITVFLTINILYDILCNTVHLTYRSLSDYTNY